MTTTTGSGVITLDPAGVVHGMPTWPWRGAPNGYATYRQLRALGLRPGGQQPVAQVLRPRRGRRGPLRAYLYRVADAAPVRPMTPAKWAAVWAAAAARRVCDACRRDVGYVPPARTGGRCWDCYDAATTGAPA